MTNYSIQEETVNAMADVVREKAGITTDMSPLQIANVIYTLETDTDSDASDNGVKFYDYDGTLLYSYTVGEARVLTALPEGPTHDGLTFGGWTHTLNEVNATAKCLDVGAMYEMPASTKLTLVASFSYAAVNLYYYQTAPNGINIDWGDGSNSVSNLTAGACTVSHTYNIAGTYTVNITVNSGTFYFGYSDHSKYIFGSSHYQDTDKFRLTSIILGAGIDMISHSSQFANYCENVKSVLIPKGITAIARGTFMSTGMTACIIPNTITRIEEDTFWGNFSLRTIVLPESITYIGPEAFEACAARHLIVPSKAFLAYLSISLDLSQYKPYPTNIYIRSPEPRAANRESYDPISQHFVNTRYVNIYVPFYSVSKYKEHINWAYRADSIKGEPVPVKF